MFVSKNWFLLQFGASLQVRNAIGSSGIKGYCGWFFVCLFLCSLVFYAGIVFFFFGFFILNYMLLLFFCFVYNIYVRLNSFGPVYFNLPYSLYSGLHIEFFRGSNYYSFLCMFRIFLERTPLFDIGASRGQAIQVFV